MISLFSVFHVEKFSPDQREIYVIFRKVVSDNKLSGIIVKPEGYLHT